MEANNPLDTELKTLVIRILKELRGRLDQLSEDVKKQ